MNSIQLAETASPIHIQHGSIPPEKVRCTFLLKPVGLSTKAWSLIAPLGLIVTRVVASACTRTTQPKPWDDWWHHQVSHHTLQAPAHFKQALANRAI